MTPPKSILFVCTGNTCRSPMAELLFRRMLETEGLKEVRLASRGVAALDGDPASHGTRAALKAVGLDAGAHRALTLSAQDVREADLILVMEDAHRAIVLAGHPAAASKTFLLNDYAGRGGGDIRDPIGGSPADYEKCRIEIQDALLGLLSKVKGHSK